jgi:O-antigen/teichoic acid export membrane protein
LIGLLTLGTVGALTTALALVLSSEIGPVGAALALAAGMAGLALGLIALLLFYQRRDRRQAAASRQAWSLVGSALGTVVPNMVQRTPFSALVATGAAAFLLSLWLNPVNSSPKEGEMGPHQTKD